MNKLMLTKADHYIHVRKVILSQDRAELIYSSGETQIDDLDLPEPLQGPIVDTFSNVRRQYLISSIEEITLRLVFEQGWEEAKYVDYPVYQPHKKVSPPPPPPSSNAQEFMKLMQSYEPVISKLPSAWKPVGYVKDSYHNHYAYHTPGKKYYESPEFVAEPVLVKDIPEFTKKGIAVEAELAAKFYDYSAEKKYNVITKVVEQPDMLVKITVAGSCGPQMYKVSHLTSLSESFLDTVSIILKMKKTIVDALKAYDLESYSQEKFVF